MTAAGHAGLAVQLLGMATDHDPGPDSDRDYEHEQYLLAAAQVRATLAVADAIRALAPAPALIEEPAARPAPAECCDAADLLALAQAEIDRLRLTHPCRWCGAPVGEGCVSQTKRLPRRPHRSRSDSGAPVEVLADRHGCLWVSRGDEVRALGTLRPRSAAEADRGPLRSASWPGDQS